MQNEFQTAYALSQSINRAAPEPDMFAAYPEAWIVYFEAERTCQFTDGLLGYDRVALVAFAHEAEAEAYVEREGGGYGGARLEIHPPAALVAYRRLAQEAEIMRRARERAEALYEAETELPF